MTTIIALSGSLRKGSYNTTLLHAAAGMMPAGSVLSVRTIHGIPVYSEDDEAALGIPSLVEELKASIAEADGFILATPEYNNSLPGGLKNAVDWLSRPAKDIPRVFAGRPVALMGATPGGLGTALGQNAWLPVLRFLGTKPWFGGRLAVPQAHLAFDATGQITDPVLRENLKTFLTGFVRFSAAEHS